MDENQTPQNPAAAKLHLARLFLFGNRSLTEDPVEGPAYLERVPLRRFAEPTDIADAVFFLASEAAAYITGEQLVVDGGVTVGVHIPDAPSGFEAKQ